MRLGKDCLFFLADYNKAIINVRFAIQDPYFSENIDTLHVKNDVLYSEKYSEPLSLDYLNKTLSQYHEIKKQQN